MLSLTSHMDAERLGESTTSKSSAAMPPPSAGKHAALWNRMKAKKQLLHPQQPSPSAKESDVSIPNSVTLSSDDDDDEEELLGTRFDQDDDDDETVHSQAADNVLTAFLGTPETFSDGSPPTSDTPGMFWKQWKEELDAPSPDSCHRVQEHMDSSIADDGSLDQTKLSLATLDQDQSLAETPSKQRLPFNNDDVNLLEEQMPSSRSPMTAMRRNSMHQALQESNVYLKRIHELEEALMATKAQLVVSQNGDVLGDNEDVVEALGGTPLSQNTAATAPNRFHALWQRNQTLVKEVRFAEQTCVEISQRHKALQAQTARLEMEQTRKNQEIGRLQNELRHAETAVAEWRAMSDPLQMEELKAVCQERLEQIQSLEDDKVAAEKAIADLKEQLARAQDVRPAADARPNEKLQADVTILRKELEIARADQVSQKALISQLEANVNVDIHPGDSETPVEELSRSNRDSESQREALSEEIRSLKAKLSETQESLEEAKAKLCSVTKERDDVECCASSRIKELEEAKAMEVCRLKELYSERAQMALRGFEVQTIDFQRQAYSKVNSYNERLMALTSMVDSLRASLELKSQMTSSEQTEQDGTISVALSDGEVPGDERLSGESLVSTPPRRDSVDAPSLEGLSTPEKDSTGVLNATLTRGDQMSGALEDERMMEQMEEARHDDLEDHQEIEGLSQIDSSLSALEVSSLMSDCSHDPESISEPSAFYVKSILPYLDSASHSASIDHVSASLSPTSVAEECTQLKLALEYLRESTAPDQEHIRAMIYDQKPVLQSIEDKFDSVIQGIVQPDEARVPELEAELGKSRAAGARLESELSSVKSSLCVANREIELKGEVIAFLEQDRDGLTQQCESLSDSAQEATRLFESQNNRIMQIQQAAKEEVSHLKESLAAAKDEAAELESKLVKLEESSPKTDVPRLEESLHQAQKKLLELEKAYMTSQTDLLRATETNLKGSELATRYEKELQLAESRAEKFDEDIASAKASADQAAAALSCLEMDLKHSRRTIEEQESAIAVLEAEKAAFDAKYEAAHLALCEASRTQSSLEDRLANVEADRNELAHLNKTLQATAVTDDYRSQVELLKTELESTLDAMEHLKDSYMVCNDKLANASEQNANKDAIVEQYQKAHMAAKEMVEHSEKRLADMRSELEDALQSKAALEDRLESISEDLRLTTDDLARYQLRNGKEHDRVVKNLEHAVKDAAVRNDDQAASFQMTLFQIMSQMTQMEQAVIETLRQAGITIEMDDPCIKPNDETAQSDWKAMAETAEAQLRSLHAIVEAVSDELCTKQLLQDRTDASLREERQRANALFGKLRAAERTVAEAESEIAQTASALRATQEELSRATEVSLQDETVRQLDARNASLERKCSRLRDYIRQLTAKCDEWAKSYEQQAKVLQASATQT